MTGNDAVATAEMGARPIVARSVSNRGVWLFAGIAGAVAVGLFGALEARRTAVTSPAVTNPARSQGGMITAPPDLAIPADIAEPLPPLLAAPIPSPAIASPPLRREIRTQRTYAPYGPPPSYSGPIAGQSAAPPPAPAFVYQAPPAKIAAGSGDEGKESGSRIAASRFVNPATTVPQGAVVQAVLETALDSNRPGYARAIVTRDVFSFDGTRILIPRGSKLFGEYKADLAAGQNRALIQWHRLTRPDGVIIDIDSPSADPLGRAGVKGKVNSHFFARFGGALLQSVLDVGVQLAARKATGDTIIVGLPGSVPQVTVTKPDEVKPTLTVKEGTSVSVFVVHDLDFTTVEP
jgi:type IV secretion system protein VirB10